MCVCFPDCPALLAGSLQPLCRLPQLELLTLSGGVTDAALDSLSGCSKLRVLRLGDLKRPVETAITAAAVSRSVRQNGCLLSETETA